MMRLIQCLIITLILILVFTAKEITAKDEGKIKITYSKPKFHRALIKESGKGGFAFKGIRRIHKIEDYLLASIEKALPASPWFEAEKNFYRNLIDNQSFDVLVVPFQTQLDGVDPIGRSLMSYRLALEIEQQTTLKVAPLPIVHFALGSHARHYDDNDIYALAKSIGVSHIVWGFTGTQEGKEGHVKSLNITIVYQSKSNFGSPSGSRAKKWEKIDLKHNQLPSLLFEARLSEIMAFINLPRQQASKDQGSIQQWQPHIPISPGVFFKTKADDGISTSWLYQFMGMLTPSRSEFHRQYMFIRSLIALSRVDPKHPDYPILKARAYHHLNRRPAAIHALQNDNSDRAYFLREIINGNLPQLNTAIEHIKPPLDKLFCTLEYAALMYRYTGKYPQEQIDQLLAQYPEWQYFFELDFQDGNGWHVPHNLILKQTLETHFPVQGFSLEQIIGNPNQSKTPEAIDLSISLAFQRHIQKSLAQLPVERWMPSHTKGPNAFDHLMMLEGVGVSNLLKQLNYISNIQCLPKEAMNLCLEYLKTYQGHPYFVLYYADISAEKVSVLHGPEKQKRINQSVYNAKLGLWWYGRQGWAFSLASPILRPRFSSDKELLNQYVPYQNLLYGIACDYPFIPKYARKGFMRPYEDLIDWSCCDVKDAKFVFGIYQHDKKMMAEAREKIKRRFLGHPDRYKLELAAVPSKKTAPDQKEMYAQLINNDKQNWKLYQKLGNLYIAEGKFKEAQKTFLSYPGFKDFKNEHPVGLSNKAGYTGNELFWKGAYNEARPFFELSAGLKTGSAASLNSSLKMALLDLELESAARVALRCAQRYDDALAYCDYMSILHLLGDSDVAWNQFNNLLGKYSYPYVWTSAWVGHRIQNTRHEDLKNWIKTITTKSQTSAQRSFPARFALMCLNDRPPDMEMAEFVSMIDDLSQYDFSNSRMLKGPKGTLIGPEYFGILHHTEFVDATTSLPIMSKGLAKAKRQYYEHDVPTQPFSFYGSFAKAYENLKSESYTKAYDQLIQHSLGYAYSMDFGKPLKSYLVWAGIKSGHRNAIERYLHSVFIQAGLKQSPFQKKVKPENIAFDDQLSLAAYACGIGDNDLSVAYLRKAFNNRPGSLARPFSSMYQIVELCEWFYQHSKDHRFLELVLKWSKDFQVIRPMYGYPYAFEAKYTGNEQDRLRALAYALYLDPQSWHIAHFSDELKNKARQWFEKHNEFQTKQKNI